MSQASVADLDAVDAEIGARMLSLVEELFPICRSITGNGVRETLRLLSNIHPISVTEVASGTHVFDWTVPDEWNIRDAYIKDSSGRRVVDFKRHNLHVLSYSAPVRAQMRLAELEPHLYSLPDQPDLIPYRTSYYARRWGFCMTHKERQALDRSEIYEVVIDSELKKGSLSIGEIVLPGESDSEIIVSAHTCHPSLCNDNLSGLVVAVQLAAALAERRRRKTYRFIFAPGTIGSIAWLSLNQSHVSRIGAGLVVTGVGDRGSITYKKSRRGDALIDRAARHVLATKNAPHKIIDFHPYGYDERQYCSPGFNLGVGRFSRTPHGEYPEYHTSADNLAIVSAPSLTDSYRTILDILEVVEHDRTFDSLSPFGEPQLGKRGLYREVAGQAHSKADELALLWLLSYADGAHSLLDIAEKSHLPHSALVASAERLERHGLIKSK
jgi:aminopeptidase-like protein